MFTDLWDSGSFYDTIFTVERMNACSIVYAKMHVPFLLLWRTCMDMNIYNIIYMHSLELFVCDVHCI